MPDVDVRIEPPLPPIEDDSGDELFMVNVWLNPPGSALVSASLSLSTDAPAHEVAAALIRAITAAAQGHSAELAGALQRQLYIASRPSLP